MAKLIGPLMSIDARGKFGGAIVYSGWKGIAYARQYFIPQNPNSADQQLIRAIVKDAAQAWKLESTIGGVIINAAFKLAYDTLAIGRALSGFNLYMQDCMAMNNTGTPGSPAYDGTLEIPATPGAIT